MLIVAVGESRQISISVIQGMNQPRGIRSKRRNSGAMEREIPMSKIRLFASAILLANPLCHVANAALGEPHASVQSDAEKLRAVVTVTQSSRFEVNSMKLPSGTHVREYTASDGKVFAVAWNGPTVPDLRQALGATFFDRYVSAAKVNRLGRHQLRIEQSDFVMHAGGPMRAYAGVAYLPQALPAGVTPEDLK